jgi:hypothetical protein
MKIIIFLKCPFILFFFPIFFFIGLAGCSGGGGGEGISGGDGIPVETNGKITLLWDSVTTPDLGGYRVYFGKAQGFYENSIDVGMADRYSQDTTGYSLTGLIKGQTYYLVVTDYNRRNIESRFSNEVSGVAK